MLPVDRREKLLSLLQERRSASTEELASALGVSSMTVRRDLVLFQKEGQIQRCHGGAVLTQKNVQEAPYDLKMTASKEQKQTLAKIAAKMVTPGSTVYLDAGTTTYLLAEELVKTQDLTVITNDLKIALLLLSSPVEVILLGGKVQKKTGSMIGSSTLEQMGSLRASIAFVGTASIDDSFANLTPTQDKVALKRSIRSIAKKTYLIADASKFHSSALYFVDRLSDYDGVITDAIFTEAEQRMLGKKTQLITP